MTVVRWIGFGVLVAAMVAARWLGSPVEAADTTESKATAIVALKQMLANSGLKYEWLDEQSAAVISFSDIEHAASNRLFVYISDEKGYYITMFLTLVDKPKGHRFSPAMLREAMKRNHTLRLVKLSFDEAQGDIDARIGFDRDGVSPQVFKDYVLHLVIVGDELAKELKAYLE